MKRYIAASALIAAFSCAVYAQTALPAAQKAAPEIKIEKIVTAASIENREPVNGTAAFDSATTRFGNLATY